MSNFKKSNNKRGRRESMVWSHFFRESIGDVTSLLNVIIAQKLGLEGNLKHCSAVPTNVKFEYMQILAEQSFTS